MSEPSRPPASRTSKFDRPEPPSGPLSIVLSCPKCGAPFTVDDTAVSVACEHCGSLLILSAPERDEIYRAEEVVRGKGDLAAMVIDYRVAAQRAEIVERFSDREGNPPSELFIQMRLSAFEDRLRETVQVLDAHRIQVPYWHVTGRIVQAILGRRGDGPKVMRVRAWALEHTLPGYDTQSANLRDRGLRLSQSRVRPLTVDGVRERGPFLPWLPMAPQSSREIERWKGQDLEPGLEAITRHGRFLPSRRFLIYRAYWLARVSTDRGIEWLLVDGSFATIAGYPDEAEVVALLRLAGIDPLRSGGESYRRVTIVASRCPDCGWEARLDPAWHVVVCANCHRALEPAPSGIRIVPYDHMTAPTMAPAYLPFWRFDARIQVAGGPSMSSLEDYGKALFPQGPPPGFALRGAHLWVPAFRLLGTEHGDESFQELTRWIHQAALETVDGKIPLGIPATTWGASVSESEARELGPIALFALHGRPSAAKLNTRSFTSVVAGAKLTLGSARLVMIPFSPAEDALCAPASTVRLPGLLLRGGPELEAQRASVHKARATVVARLEPRR